MPISSDADVVAAVPVLKPLLALAGSSVSWKHLSSHDGYSVSELPPIPALGLPMKCYRTQFVVNGDLDLFQRVLSDEASIREFDSALKEMRILERRASKTLLYTSYVSPFPWLVTPRDFCVWSAGIFTTLEQLKRVCSEAKEGSPQSFNSALAVRKLFCTCQQSGEAPDPGQRVYLQNSVTALVSDSAAVPTPQSGTLFVRGVVYCFGYVAFADPSIQGTLRVTHYCCVDPAGQIPTWLVAAAVDENTKKLRKMAELVEAAAAAAAPAAEPTSACLNAPSADPLPAKEPQEPAFTSTGSAEEPSEEAKGEDVSTPLFTKDPCDEAPSLAVPTVEGFSDSGAYPSPDAEGEAVLSMAPESTDVSPSPRPMPKEQRSFPPPPATCRNTATHDPSLTSTPPQPPGTAASVDPRVEILSLLARSNGWCKRREVEEIQYAELRILPEPLRSKDPLCIAMRVSALVRCTLDTFVAVLRNPALFPEIDPELVRVVAASTSSGASSRTASCEPSTAGHGSAPTAGELRHYQFDATDPFRSPWEMILLCSDFELTQIDGGRYGFHTPGVPAATHVWVSADSTTSCYRGVHPDGYHQHMQVRVFGVTAVAVPRSAESIRVSQYMLFDACAPLLLIPHSSWHISFQKKCPTEEFVSGVSRWMEGRMNRLRRLSEERHRRRNSSAMVALDKVPLLRFLYTVHCAESGRALKSPEAAWYGDVLARAIRWTGKGGCSSLRTEAGSGDPPLVVLSTVFPCSLAQLRKYMLFSSPRHRYALERGIDTYEELAAPPEFTTVRVVYGAASASFPRVRLTVLEAFGELHGVNVPCPTLVLSRAGIDGDVGDESDELDFGESFGHLRVSADKRFEDGRVFCSGWVATTLEGSGSQSCANDPWAAVRSPHSGLAPVSPELCTERSISGGKAEEAALHQPECIVVTQYLSIGLPSAHQRDLDADGLPCGCVAEQAALLQRFRDSVCTWGSPVAATTSE
ncbi:hypothetical protein LMJF_36_4960 [Leishmania major strain Friedlin]|uniref:START domain-containing protein n=1 Tax=Leishmania major TaxID=5664 RepID=Q4Q0R6_LEIMA|nr:hypothetical protein LMJF_36_4960 [Leishmania major strain Friedlin]CAG9584048.1 hypothetical_protein_-_conserved [Leishmania major strain Friedlin]CAJ09468.1 hypothetical protein LMJF_36_4960 [Leishmania major strain Friedlin]|eukprot:XP_001687082.1 hypothetical protein LMJF_36_4960 [Leishmania major strain Friedlin]